MSRIVEQCIVDGELTPALLQYKQELDHNMNAELAAIDADKGNMWIPKERQYAEVRQKYEVAWEAALSEAGYMLRPTFESIQPEFIDWYDQLTPLQEATYTKPISLQDAQKLLRSYAKEVDFKLADEYTQTFGILPVDGVSLVEAGLTPHTSIFEPPQPLYNIYFKGWDRYYPKVELSRLFNKAAMMKLLIDGFTRSLHYFKIQETTKILKSIDVFTANKYAMVVAVGSSGNLYELSGNVFGDINVSVNGGDFGPATLLKEPFEIIYTKVSENDGNRSTRRDSHSIVYHSWSSKHVGQLDKYLPTTFGRIEGPMGSYSETVPVDNPSSKKYSRADQIDSWAMTENVEVATD